jgi:hypothetical protein
MNKLVKQIVEKRFNFSIDDYNDLEVNGNNQQLLSKSNKSNLS